MTDRYWAAIRDALHDQGIDAPNELTRDRPLWDIWQHPDLLLAQTCGLPFRARLHQTVELVATPDFNLPGCPPGFYNSVILTGPSPLPERPRVAINEPMSQSGWAALHDWSAQEAGPLGPIRATGSHAASVAALENGEVDLAAIDAQTWRLIQNHGAPHSLREHARTPPTPALPYITAKGQDPTPIRAALQTALETLSACDRGTLGLRDIVHIPAETYLAIPLPPNP